MKAATSILSVIVILSIAAWAQTPATEPAASGFTGVKEVRLSREAAAGKVRALVITDMGKIERLVGTIKLEKKEPCACEHLESAVFVTDAGEIKVSLCDHCFDFGGKTYRMPAEFYRLFQTYLSEAATQPAASQPATRPVDANAVAELIRQLGHDKLPVRELATKKLIEMGEGVVPLLKAKAQEPNLDPEVAARITAVLEKTGGRPPIHWLAAQRLPDLKKKAGSLDFSVRIIIDKGNHEELHLLGPDHGGYKEPVFARLSKEEMNKLLDYLAVEGFLANAKLQTLHVGPGEFILGVGNFAQQSPLNADTIKRLEAIKTVLPEQAATKLAGLLQKVRGQAAPTTQPALTDAQMLELATQAVTKDSPKAVVAPARSKNLHLGQQAMPNPMPNWSFFCAVLGQTPTAPIRQYLAVSRSGQVIYPLKAEKFSELLAAEDKNKWKDEDYLNAAVLRVHLMSVANEDGWKFLEKPEDFMAITFNMASVGAGGEKRAEKRQEAAKQIVAPKIERKDGQVTVTFYAWHLIGGYLRQWQVQIGPKTEAAKQELGRFGGGGYD